jgi:diadenosine tetraphosphate (Ap4A) HIT family hydrolase
MSECIFCQSKEFDERIVKETERFLLVYSKYAVSDGHLLIIPKRHYAFVFLMEPNEWEEFGELLTWALDWIFRNYNANGMNIGWNVGEGAGQTVMHTHCHIIPRYKGDVEDPSGGIRHVIPEKAKYKNYKSEEEYERAFGI